MKDKIYSKLRKFRTSLLLTLVFITIFTTGSFVLIETNSARVYEVSDISLAKLSEDISVGIVFGGGVNEDKPTDLVIERLNTAISLLGRGIVDKLIVSGDNRFLDYNEPTVMKDYLVSEGVNPNLIQEDFAGRSTYETCERASKIFGITSAILISESTHLTRAVFLCRHFGIDSYGAKSDSSVSANIKVSQEFREVLARNKAIFNAYIYGERTVLGDPIDL
ncbi:MAG: SanA protein [Candidatus Saccharimonadales bacterium]|jgi:SanA protein